MQGMCMCMCIKLKAPKGLSYLVMRLYVAIHNTNKRITTTAITKMLIYIPRAVSNDSLIATRHSENESNFIGSRQKSRSQMITNDQANAIKNSLM